MITITTAALAVVALGFAPGNFQRAAGLEKGENALGFAGQAIIEEGDSDQLLFPTVEAWYNMRLGPGEFTVKMFSPIGVRAGFKQVLFSLNGTPFGYDLGGSVAQSSLTGPASGTCRLSIRWAPPKLAPESESTCNSEQSTFMADLVLRADVGAYTLAPKVAFGLVRQSSNLPVMDDNYPQLLTGAVLGRRVVAKSVTWWFEIAAYWGRRIGLAVDPYFSENATFLLFAPGVGASIEF